jgi:putative glutamine amidotransferase
VAPVIGITSTPLRQQSPVLPVERALNALDRAYIDAVCRAGGASVVLPVQDPSAAAAVIGHLDALVLSGGGDVAPERYGAARHPAVGGVDETRDAWEVELIHEARRQHRPILGICRGAQILNVALGGTLIQHLPDHEPAQGDPHLAPDRFDDAAHHVVIEPGSRLAKVLDREGLCVNTLHHQAIDRCADELVVVARDQHGIIEAVEHADEPILAVQWHPELIAHVAPHDQPFRWVVEEAGSPAGR